MKKDYSRLSKEELLKVIEKLESRKRYGLIWDEERTKEQFEKDVENALPVLKEVRSREIKTDSFKPVVWWYCRSSHGIWRINRQAMYDWDKCLRNDWKDWEELKM